MNRSTTRKNYLERKKNPDSFCYRCRKRAVVMEMLGPMYPGDVTDRSMLGEHGLCHQHSTKGRKEAAIRAAIVRAAPNLLKALIGVKNGECWCDVGISSPLLTGHSLACVFAQSAVLEAKGEK